MNIKSFLSATGFSVIFASLAGCTTTGGLITSLEDLTTESVAEGFFKIPQERVASIPGWLPFADVGGLYFYKAQRKPAAAIGLSPGDSFELVSEIPGECDDDCLLKIRDNITELDIDAQTLVQTRVDLSARQSDARADAKAVEEAKTNYKKAQDKFNESYKKVVLAIRKNGVLIYRWATNSSQSEGLTAGSFVNTSAKQEQKRNGFALVNGIRTKTLFIGEDMLKGWKKLDTDSRFANRFLMTTYVMQTRNILYGSVSDLSTFAHAKVQASYQDLMNAPELLKLTQIEIEMTLAKISNLSNIGMMGKMSRKTNAVNWDEGVDLQKRLATDTWLTFYSVGSDYTDLVDLLKQKQAR
jgi:hypothetical protein